MIPPLYRICVLDKTTSTNADAKRAAEAGEAEGLVVVARQQTAGRGRYGRNWESPVGNLYASVLLRPKSQPQNTGHYSFVAALAAYDTVCAFLPGEKITLKWPNDVLVNGKKISGILLEAAPVENDIVEWLIIGAGINVLHHPEAKNTLYQATSLATEIANGLLLTEKLKLPRGLGERLSPDVVLEVFLQSLEKWRGVYLLDGFAPIRSAWLTCAQKGRITACLPQEIIDGEFKDLDGQGNLILRLLDGSERAIAVGDIFFENQEPGISNKEEIQFPISNL